MGHRDFKDRLYAQFARIGKALASPQRLELLDLLAQGRANLAIATRLSLSPKTVRNHVSSILAKLQVTDRAQAIIQARDAGMGQVSHR